MGLNLSNIRKRLGEFHLSLDLEVKEGELLSLLGPSGCGKTTVLRLIAGIEEPDEGTVHVDGNDITSLPVHLRNVGMVFQYHALFPHMSVGRNIAYGPRTKGWTSGRITETVERLLGIVGLHGYADRRVDQLSGGEQQRVALARALAADPRLILLDEPLSSLDAQLKTRLRKEIRRIQQELGITAVYVTHDQEEALAISDRVAVMNNGRIEQIGTPKELYRSPDTEFVASFIGKSNILSGTVEKVADGEYQVSTAIGQVAAKKENCLRHIKEGEEVQVFFRPEAVQLSAERYGGSDSRAGRILAVEYQGKSSLAEMRFENVTILAEVPPESSWKQGEEAKINIAPAAVRLYDHSRT